MLKPEVVKALTDARIDPDAIKDLDGLLGNVSGAVGKCDWGETSRLFFDMSETVFEIERRLPKRCPTTEAVITVLDQQLQQEFNTALFGLKECRVKAPRAPRPAPPPVKPAASTSPRMGWIGGKPPGAR